MCRPSGDHDGKSLLPASCVTCSQLLAGDVHHVDVLSAGIAGTVLAVPTEGQHAAVGRPRRRDGIAAVGHALHIGAILIHHVDLRLARAPADKSQSASRCADSTPAKHPLRRSSPGADCRRSHPPPRSPDARIAPRRMPACEPSADHAGDWLLPPAVPAGKLTSAAQVQREHTNRPPRVCPTRRTRCASYPARCAEKSRWCPGA